MTLEETLIAAWRQALVEEKSTIELDAEGYRVIKSSSKRLRTVTFDYAGHTITGIEQNPRTASRWAELAREGKRIMQFSIQGRYIGNVCEGKLVRYGAWQAMELPE